MSEIFLLMVLAVFMEPKLSMFILKTSILDEKVYFFNA